MVPPDGSTMDGTLHNILDDIDRYAHATGPAAIESDRAGSEHDRTKADWHSDRARTTAPVIVVTWGPMETPWQHGFTLRQDEETLQNVTIEPILVGDYIATFETIPYLEKGKPEYLVPDVVMRIGNPPDRADFKILFDRHLQLLFHVVGIQRGGMKFKLTYRAEGRYASDVITIYPVSGSS